MMARSEESHSGSESDDILNQQVGIEESLHDLSSAGMVPHPEESKALSSIMTTSQPSVTNILGKRERDGPAAITIDDIYQPKKKIHRKRKIVFGYFLFCFNKLCRGLVKRRRFCVASLYRNLWCS
jgi:hypothetical protein